MTPEIFLRVVMAPGLLLLPRRMDTREARVLLLAFAGQETNLCERHQIAPGSAHGFWQCERMGAVKGVLDGPGGPYAKTICDILAIPTDLDSVFEAIRLNDALATVIARLALWVDPHPLPTVGDSAGAWAVYERVWGPGMPGPARWPTAYAAAVAAQ